VDDAKRHGVEVRPVDVLVSGWDCTLEPSAGSFAVRMGLRYVKGMGKAEGERILAARAAQPFASVEDLARRTQLNDKQLPKLAESGALASFGGGRRDQLWTAYGLSREAKRPFARRTGERSPELEGLDAFESIAWDYRAS